MSKKIVSLVLAMAFVAVTAAASFAEDCKGKVTAVEGDQVTVECKDGSTATGTGEAKVGDKVTIKDGKVEAKKKVIEGC